MSQRVNPPFGLPLGAFFEDCLVKKGVVTSRGLETMVAILNKARVVVTVEALQPNVALLHPTGDRS